MSTDSSKRTTVDVAIIGAGPAGAVAAALLRQAGRSVLVLERQHFPRFSIGESLLPQSMAYLEEAGMLQAVVEAGFQYKNGAHFIYRDQSSAFDFRDKHSPGWGTTYQVERAVFDDLLIRCAAEQGADVRFGHTVRAMQTGDAPVLEVVDEAASVYEVQARFVFDASGFGRVLPRLLNLEAPTRMPTRAAIFTHVRDGIPTGATDRNKICVATHPERRDVWFWMIPLANGRSSVGCVAEASFLDVPEAERDAKLRALIQQEPTLNALIGEAPFLMPVRQIGGYAANVERLHGPGLRIAGQRGRVSRSGVLFRGHDRAALGASRGADAEPATGWRTGGLVGCLRCAVAQGHRHLPRVRRALVHRRVAGHHFLSGADAVDPAHDQFGAGRLCVGRIESVCGRSGAASECIARGLHAPLSMRSGRRK